MKLLLPRFKGFAGTQAVYHDEPKVIDPETGREAFGYKGGDDEVYFRRAASMRIQAFRIVEGKEIFLLASELMDIIEKSKKNWELGRGEFESLAYEPFYITFGEIEFPSSYADPEMDPAYKEWKKKKES